MKNNLGNIIHYEITLLIRNRVTGGEYTKTIVADSKEDALLTIPVTDEIIDVISELSRFIV